MKVRTRFAPSPTGFMHLGGMRTALYCYLFAKQHGGDFILRIEDTDQERFVEGAIDVIYSSLKEAGMDYDEGPDKGGDYGPYIQSQRKDIYLKYAKELVERGGAYYCFCTKERVESLRDENGNVRYDKHCLDLSKEEIEKNLAAGIPYVIRQNIPEVGVGSYEDAVFGHIAVDYSELEDGVLIKSDGLPTYNFANVVDDHSMGITHVLRGNEYLSSTPQYNLLYDAFGWERPSYVHLPVIMKDKERKLSKRHGDANFEDFIAKGYLPQAIVNYIALLGWNPDGKREKLTLEEMVELFDVSRISSSPSIFDEPKMRWLNAEYVRELSADEFYALALPYLEKSKCAGKYDYKALCALLQPRTEIFSDIPSLVDFLEEYKDFPLDLFTHVKNKTDLAVAKTVLQAALPVLQKVDNWNNDELFAVLSALSVELGIKKGAVMWCVRIALTGKESTPGGATEMAALIGKEESIKRILEALERLA